MKAMIMRVAQTNGVCYRYVLPSFGLLELGIIEDKSQSLLKYGEFCITGPYYSGFDVCKFDVKCQQKIGIFVLIVLVNHLPFFFYKENCQYLFVCLFLIKHYREISLN